MIDLHLTDVIFGKVFLFMKGGDCPECQYMSRDELHAHQEKMAKAAEHDHKRLAAQLGLFSTSDEIGQGLVLWHPKGATIRFLLEQFSQRFKMKYVGSDGKNHTPYIVHRALFGSIERFFALLIEHYKGDFPLWYTPVQFAIVPISPTHHGYCKKFYTESIIMRINPW